MYSNMKKSFLALASFAAIAVACQVEKMDNELPLVNDAVVYTASTEAYAPATKTAMDGLDVVWSAGDQIAVFQGVDQPDIFALDEGVNTTSASFVFEEEGPYKEYSQPLDFNVAYYPYTEEMYYVNWGDATARLQILLSDVQTYTEDTFAEGAFPMLAVTESVDDKSFEFKNLLGLLKLSLKGTKTIKSIAVAGNRSQVLAGQFMALIENGIPSVMPGDYPKYTSVSVDCGDGVQLNATTETDFYIALPETEFTDGFTLTITDSEGNIYKKGTSTSNKVSRSKILAMPEFDMDELTPPVELEATSYINDVDIEFTITDDNVTAFYGIFASQDSWDNMSSYFTDPTYFQMLLEGYFATEGGAYLPAKLYSGRHFEGKLSEFGWSEDELANGKEDNYGDIYMPDGAYNELWPDASFNVIIVPVYEGKESYSLADALIYPVSTVGITTGGNIALPNYETTLKHTSVTVNFDASDDVAFGYYGFYKEDQEHPTQDTYIDMLYYDIEFAEDGSFAITRNLQGQEMPGTSYTLYVMLGGNDGKTVMYTIEDLATKEISVDEGLKVTFLEADFESADDVNEVFATVTDIPEGAELYYAIGQNNNFRDYQIAKYQAEILDGTSTFFNRYDLEEDEDEIEISTIVNRMSYETSRYVFVILVKDSKISPMLASAKITVPKAN